MIRTAQAPIRRGATRCLRVIVAVLPLVAATGCGAYRSLADEHALPDLVALNRRAAEVPTQTTRVPVWETRSGKPVNVAVHESGRGRGDGRAVVLLHGVFSDSSAWRFVRGGLAADYHLVTIDLPGCGASDAPLPAELPSDAYGLDSLARAVLIAVRASLGGGDDAPRVTLAGHSLGGALVLRMLGSPKLRDEFADVVERVDGAVLFNPADVLPASNQQTFDELGRLGGTKVALADATGLLLERTSAATRGAAADPTRALRQEADRSANILRDPRRRRAMQAMIRRGLPIVDGRPDWEQIDVLERDYANVSVPCLIVWGRRDDTFPAAMGYKLAAELPDARLRIVRRGRHSLPIDEPGLCAELIREMVETGMKDAPRIAKVG